MTKAAGILFVSKERRGLFLQRGPTAPDFPNVWDLPGGASEGDETAEETARREAREEIGWFPSRPLAEHTRTIPGRAPASLNAEVAPALPDVDFTTFLMKVDSEFTPELNYEHTAATWAPVTSPPQPLHPGLDLALRRLSMDELGVARAIASGELTSPQQYINMWLFAIRITGTDVAYRSKHGEFVHRNPDHYLNDEFLARCNGLPVIWKHPKKAVLDSKEFGERIVGTIFLPYIDGDEVWGIAKIFDAPTAKAMAEGKISSTSPTVYFDDPAVNTALVTEGGRKVLIEGNPSLIDHVAICELGVWDKLGPPAGIRSEAREDEQMAGEEDKAKEDAKRKADEAAMADKKAKDDAKAKADAEAGTKLDKLLSYCDSMSTSMADMKSKHDAMCGRMDAWETKEKEREDAKKKDDAAKADASKKDDSGKKDDASKKDNTEGDLSESEKEKKAEADKAKKDADEKDEKEREDAKKKADARADAQVKELLDKIDAQGREIEGIRRAHTMSDEDRYAVFDAQARADEVFCLASKHAPVPQPGETKAMYERRVARSLQEHSGRWTGFKLSGEAFADDGNFSKVYDDILSDARKKFSDSDFAGAGNLREIKRRTESGHTIIDFQGDSSSWMNEVSGIGSQRNYVTKFFDKR